MKQKSTGDLLKELSSTANYDEFYSSNKDYINSKTLSQLLTDLLAEKGLSRAEVIRKSELGDNYIYQIFSGIKKNPKRDKLICLSIGMSLSLEETNGILRFAKFMTLDPKDFRDSIIIFGKQNNKTVCEINELLFEKSEDTLN